MSDEETEKQLIPDDESPDCLKEGQETPESSSGQAENDSESRGQENRIHVSEERIRLENEAYQKHFLALQQEIEEIRKKFPDTSETSGDEDPVKRLSGEVTELKNGFGELKELIQKSQEKSAQQINQNQPFQPYQQPIQQVFPQSNPYYPPMFQTSTIMPAPPLPFIHTPSFAPANIVPPVLNGSSFNNQNGGK